MEPRARVITSLGLLASLLVVGVAGYMLIEGWDLLDALYMTVITATTVGFREVRPLSPAGMVFTMFVILFGVGVILYTLTSAVAFVVGGELAARLGVRRMKGRIDRLNEHYILCGFGRVGEEIAREFAHRKVAFVIVESNPEAIGRAAGQSHLVLEGDATSDAILEEAGIRRARCLLAVADSDAGNTYITLTAKSLNPGIFVIGRVGTPANEAKLRRAGADRVISPYILAGRRMALAATQPFVVDFIDTLAHGRHGDLILAEVEVRDGSGMAGLTVEEACRGASSITVLAVRSADGSVVVGARGQTPLAAGDQLILLGEEEELRALGQSGRA